MRERVLLISATVGILIIVLPWSSFQDHTHWSKVGWIPFVSPPVRLRDIVANILLFMPFGAAVALTTRPARGVTAATASAAGLSLAAEYAQLYSHTRFPSATDLASNIIGAAAAAYAVRWVTNRRAERAIGGLQSSEGPI